MLLLLGLGLPASAAPPADQTLVIQVAVPGERRVTSMRVELTRGGLEPVRLALVDTPGEQVGAPYDGVWTAVYTGTAERYAQLSLSVAVDEDAAAVVFAGVVRTEDLPITTLGFRLSEPNQPLVARREVFALPGHAAELASSRPVWAAFGWLWVMVLWAGALVARAEARQRAAT